LQICAGTNAARSFTVAAWVRPTSFTNYPEVWSFQSTAGNRALFLQAAKPESGDPNSYMWSDTNGSFRQGAGATLGASTGKWVHVAVSFDGSLTANNYKFTLFDPAGNAGAGSTTVVTHSISSTTANVAIATGATNLLLGKGQGNGVGQNWNGRIDDFVVFNSIEDLTSIRSGTHLALSGNWTGAGANPNHWNDSANWQGGTLPARSRPLVFDTANTTNTNNFAANSQFKGITFNSGAAAFTLAGNAVNLTGDVINNDADTQTIGLTGGLVLDGGTRTFNAAAGNVTVSCPIHQAAAQTNGLTKTGSATLTLSSPAATDYDYEGATTVNAGTLALNGATLSASNVSVSGATAVLAGSGTLSLSVSVDSSGKVAPGVDASTPGTLAMNSGLSLHTAALDFQLGTSSDAIAVTGNLTLTGNTSLSVSALAGFTYGTYTLITYSGSVNGGGAILPPANTGTYGYNIITSTLGQIRLEVYAPPATKTWNGRVGLVDNATWDVAATQTWKEGGTPATYNESVNGNDPVIFHDSAAGTTAVSLNTSVSPFSVTFSNTVAKSYSISGNGSITGATPLTVSGSGPVTLNTTNTFTGDTVLSGGSLTLGNSNALAGSTLNYNHQGGTLNFGSLSSAALGGLKGAQNLILENATANPVELTLGGNNQNPTYDGVLGGPGGLIKDGNGVQTLSLGSTYQGATTVRAGTLTIPTLVNTSGVTVTGGILNLQSFNASAAVAVSSGGTAHISGSGLGLTTIANDGGVNFTAASGTTTLTGLSGSGTTTFTSEAAIGTLSSTGNANFNGATATVTDLGDTAIVLANGTILTVETGTQTTGSISGGGSLVKSGAGTLTLGGSNVFTTITINGGTLSTSTLGSGSVFFSGGGILEFTGAAATTFLNTTTAAPLNVNVTTGNLIARRHAGSYPILVKGGEGTLTLANTGSQDGGDLSVTLGTVVLNGSTTINQGFANVSSITDVQVGATVKLATAAGGQVYTSAANIFHMSGGTFDLNGIASAQTPVVDGSGLITNNAASALGTAHFVVNGSNTFSGTITDGATAATAITLSGGGGTWTLTEVNTHTGNTTVNSASLILADDAGMKFKITDSLTTNTRLTGANNRPVTLDGDFTIDTTAVTLSTGTWNLVNVSALNEAFSATFTVVGFTPNAGVWTKTASGKTWTFTESTGDLTVSEGSTYNSWATSKGLSGANSVPGYDADFDGYLNFYEFAFNGDPLSGSNNGYQAGQIANVPAVGNPLILTFATRQATVFTGNTATKDGVTYTVQGSANLNGFPSPVTEVSPPIVPVGWPAAGAGYEYHTFRLNSSTPLIGSGFVRAKVESAP
jgi:autotransporter-associated beta strand protein